jgi:radical SAM superfamily enzyme YgiQ (UPF0313 family)
MLLTHGYFLAEDAKERGIMKPYAPMGLLYLSSHLKAQGLGVEVYDSTFGSLQELLGTLEAGPPGALGLYGTLMTRGNVVRIAQAARAAGWKVILGGPEPACYAREYLEAGADVVVEGEGERVLTDLLRSGVQRDLLQRIPGAIYLDDGAVRRNSPPELLGNLDLQPWPDREAVDIGRYQQAWRTAHGKSSISVITARGCPYRCNWCSHAVYGRTHRRRAPAGVVDEIAHLLRRYDPDMLWIADDVFTIHHGWLAEYAAEMKRRAIRVPFECITRADRVNERVAATLAELGCFRVWIGAESGSQRILDRMERDVSLEQVRNAVRWTKASGISTGMFLMWGYEGEELEDIEASIELAAGCRPDVCLTTVSYPIKGTPYYQRVADRLVNMAGWADTSDREFRVRGRHSRRFYKHADELLRSRLEDGVPSERIAAARAALEAARSEVEA